MVLVDPLPRSWDIWDINEYTPMNYICDGKKRSVKQLRC